MWNVTLNETTRLTIELRDLVDNGDNSVDIWDFDYPSYYKGQEKTAFERKVIDHYYFRQIGSETVGRFLHQFRTKVKEIMPYYIQLYQSQELMQSIEDPFGNVDIVETFEQETEGQGSSQASGTSSGETTNTDSTSSEGSETSTNTSDKTASEDKTHKYSNTPQGNLSNLDNYLTEGSIDDNTYSEDIESTGTSSNTNETTSSGSSTASSTNTGSSSSTSKETIKHTLTKKGNQGVNTYAHDMKELRDTFLNIDMMVINELNELFLGVY